ncbi:MAG: hypothetical protein JO026_00170 [Patescibacteria group bacterium]|nr:hypothetical protein [Patescibacteria group bacterium]
MLYILTGPDVLKAKKRARALAQDFEVVRFGEGGEPFENVLPRLGAQGLFTPEVVLLLERPLESDAGKALLMEQAKLFSESEMPVIVIEPELDSAVKKKIPKGAVVETFESKEKKIAAPLSVFSLTDAFTAGNRKEAWILYRRLIEGGAAPEEIHGALAWQARTLVLAARTKSAAEAGLKPFVYAKAKRAAARLGEKGSIALSRELLHMLHASRMGQGALSELLEAFLLKKSYIS